MLQFQQHSKSLVVLEPFLKSNSIISLFETMKNINEVKEQQLNSVSGESDYEYYTENGETHKVSKTVDNKIQLLSPKSTDNKIN